MWILNCMANPGFYDVARAIGDINEKLDGERYLLVGPDAGGVPILFWEFLYSTVSFQIQAAW